MQTQECHICYAVINLFNPAYFLDHEDNAVCSNAHIFDRACIQKIEQSATCPYCRSRPVYALLVPNPLKKFYERYRTSAMGDLALSSAVMAGIQRVSSAVCGCIPIRGLERLIGSSSAAAFGGYVSLDSISRSCSKSTFGLVLSRQSSKWHFYVDRTSSHSFYHWF